MRTQLLVTVKDAGMMTKAQSSLLWFVEIFKKSQINVWIDNLDSEPITLTAQSKPYELSLNPGEHIIYFDDPKREKRAKLNSLGQNLVMGSFAAGMGSASGGLAGGAIAAALATGNKRSEVRENVLLCVLAEGDELAVTVKPLKKKVKVKIEN